MPYDINGQNLSLDGNSNPVMGGITSASFNGRFYGIVLVGKKLNSSDFSKLEKYMNNKTKAYV